MIHYTRRSNFSRLTTWKYYVEPISKTGGEIPLLTCFFITGLLDAVVYITWNVWIAVQTGNTILLALSAAGCLRDRPWTWALTLISIISFILGALEIGYIARRFSHMNRLILCISFFFQTLLTITPATLMALGQADTHQHLGFTDLKLWRVYSPLAMAFGMQFATSRLMGFPELPTAVLQSAYVDSALDKNFFRLHNTKRNRRLAGIITMFLGAFVGAHALRAGLSVAAFFWIASGLKGAILVFVWLGMLTKEEEPNLPIWETDGTPPMSQTSVVLPAFDGAAAAQREPCTPDSPCTPEKPCRIVYDASLVMASPEEGRREGTRQERSLDEAEIEQGGTE